MSPAVQLVIFELDKRCHAVHLSTVERVLHAVDVTPLPQGPIIAWGVIDVQGQIVPVLSLRRRFGLPERPIAVSDQFVVARTDYRTVAVVVDAVRGVVERPAAEIIGSDKILPELEQVAGVIQLDNGIVLIQNLDRFLSLDEERALAEAMNSQATYEP